MITRPFQGRHSTQEEINAWFAAQIAEYSSIIAELRTLTGRAYAKDGATAEADFAATIERRRNDKMLSLDFVVTATLDEVAQMQRNLDRRRQSA